MHETAKPVARVVLIGVQTSGESTGWSITESLYELAELVRTAGLQVATMVTQFRDTPHPRFYMGTGKIEELKQVILDHHAEVVIADDELSPAQQRALESELGVKIMDRTSLILDIFAKRAQTFEAQLQVELAQLEYMLPRLTRMWTHLSRLGGGIGTRGPGEKQLEVDKRQIRKRITTIKDKLDRIQAQRTTQRARRGQLPMLTGAIVGYTNAGKSTLLNQLTQAGVLAENKLFATLDPTTRKLTLPSNDSILVSDTVGFIQKLPHELVSSFRATLEVVTDADVLIHVVDISNPHWRAMVDTAKSIIKEIGADKIPEIMVFNKIDAAESIDIANPEFVRMGRHCFISAKSGQRVESLLLELDRFLADQRSTMTYRIPYKRMDIVHLLHTYGKVESIEYGEEIELVVTINTIIGEKIMGNLYADVESH